MFADSATESVRSRVDGVVDLGLVAPKIVGVAVETTVRLALLSGDPVEELLRVVGTLKLAAPFHGPRVHRHDEPP